jgi:hypothetical protein
MRRLLTLSVIAGASALTTACAEGQDDLSDNEMQELRDGVWGDDGPGENPNLPGNGDLTIFFGEEEGIPGCDIWDFSSGTVHNAQDPSHDVIFTVEGDNILDPNGALLCQRDGNALVERILDAEDEAVFSILGPFVFEGELELGGGWIHDAYEMSSKLLYTFHRNDVYARFKHGGEVLVSADVNIRVSSKMRRFAIASLIAGECGGPGLPDHPDDH